MNPSYSYRAEARWTSRGRGLVEGEPQAPAIEFTAPPEFQGEAGLWTPEHFLVAAVAACFLTTFRAIAKLSKFDPAGLEVSAEGVIDRTDDGFRFTNVILRPVLTVEHETDQERGLRLLGKAERACLIARSLTSEVRMEPRVLVANVAAVG